MDKCPDCALEADRGTEPAHSDAESVRCSALVLLLARWRERKADYEAEWKEAAARRKEGDRLAAADIAMEITVCIRELEELLVAGKKENEKAEPQAGPGGPS